MNSWGTGIHHFLKNQRAFGAVVFAATVFTTGIGPGAYAGGFAGGFDEGGASPTPGAFASPPGYGAWSPENGPANSVNQEASWLSMAMSYEGAPMDHVKKFIEGPHLMPDAEIARLVLTQAYFRKQEIARYPIMTSSSDKKRLDQLQSLLRDLHKRGVDLSSEAENAGTQVLSAPMGGSASAEKREQIRAALRELAEQARRPDSDKPVVTSRARVVSPVPVVAEPLPTCRWQSQLPMPEQIFRQASDSFNRVGSKVGENRLVHNNGSDPSCQVNLEVDTRRDPMGVLIDDVRVSVNGRYSKAASTVYGRGLGVVPRSDAGIAR